MKNTAFKETPPGPRKSEGVFMRMTPEQVAEVEAAGVKLGTGKTGVIRLALQRFLAGMTAKDTPSNRSSVGYSGTKRKRAVKK